MRKVQVISLLFILLFWTLSFPSQSALPQETENVGYFFKSTVQYSNLSQDRVWNLTQREDDRTIGLFMNNRWQTVELVNSTFLIEKIEDDDDGNSIAVLKFPQSVLNSGENLSFTVWYHMVSKPRLMPSISENESLNIVDVPPSLIPEYTREERPWLTNNSSLQELALNLKGNETKVLTIIKNFVDWIKKNISYPTELHENPYYPNQTYARREGDCDDQAVLLITLSRIVGIPSYLQIGSIFLPNLFYNTSIWNEHVSIVQKNISWHGWAIVYIPPWGWLPVDLTYVRSNSDDPLSSMRSGAVTGQDTIQYLNVTHTDYVASSHELRAFLEANGFYIYNEDEMTLETNQKTVLVGVDPWLPLVFMALMVFLVVLSFVVFRQWTQAISKRTKLEK